MAMGLCINDTCMNRATKICSGCKSESYCSEKCQKIWWKKEHKHICAMQAKLYEYNQKHLEKTIEEAKHKKPDPSCCTGCGLEFDEEENPADDADECPDCGYLACMSCACDTSNGSCYCQNGNFGNPYCTMEPKWYHMSSLTGRSYRGDRHPEGYGEPDWNEYEAKARPCGNCGEVVRCLKPEYC